MSCNKYDCGRPKGCNKEDGLEECTEVGISINMLVLINLPVFYIINKKVHSYNKDSCTCAVVNLSAHKDFLLMHIVEVN